MALLKIEGQFKKYDDLLLAYGIDQADVDAGKVDKRWINFLKKIGSNYEKPTNPITDPATRFDSGKLTMVANYNAISMTFDMFMVMIDSYSKRFCANT